MLNGIRVIEIGQAFSAPFGAEILGFLGAEVIKIERPGGDDTRGWGQPFKGDSSMTFCIVNRNKKSVVLDLKQDADREKLDSLIATSDVFLHNLRAGAAEKLGFGAEQMMKKYPALIYAELGAFGNVGPLKEAPGYEMLMQAFSGIMSITGEVDGSPVRAGPSICDFGSGMWLAIGVLTALIERQKTGKGTVVSTSLYEAALNWLLVASGEYFAHGQVPGRVGNGHPDIAPYGLYYTQDGSVILGAGNDRLFGKLAGVLGRNDLLDDERFTTNAARLRNRTALDAEIIDMFKAQTSAYWLQTLKNAGVPCSPVQTVSEALEHPQTAALGIIQHSEDSPDVGYIGLPINFNGERPKLRASAPDLGRDTDSF